MVTVYLPSAPRASGPRGTHDAFRPSELASVRAYMAARPELAPTPLVSRPALARHLGLGALYLKDESSRFGLNAFKLLGARFAIESLLADGLIEAGHTLVCASEGNHGRAVAHAARAAGCACRVYLADSVAAARVEAIAAEGATTVLVRGTYDDAVRRAAADASREGWTVVSDTSWEGYERIPRLIMLGYTWMVNEMVEAMPRGWRPDAVFVPGGVGGLLAAVASQCANTWPRPPHVVCVEPTSAACLQASARAGAPTAVPGPFETGMGGLRCGEVSPLALAMAAPLVSAYIAIDDAWAERALRLMASSADGDRPVLAGLSGSAALGGLLATLEDPGAASLRAHLALGSTSSAVAIVSEGVTDPALWARVMGAE